MKTSFDIILRWVPDHGWLPIIEQEKKELYRGEFRPSDDVALAHAQKAYLSLGLKGWV